MSSNKHVNNMHKRNMKAWNAYLKNKHNEFRCEICDKKLELSKIGEGYNPDSIHWDHKTGKELITASPTRFLSKKKFNTKNLELWEKSNFGMLCKHCNFRVGSPKYRQLLLKYIIGPIH